MSKVNVSVNLAPPMFLLFLVFLVLKLTGNIAWSWLWVTAPLWGGLAIWAIFFVFILIIAAIAAIFG
jgi:hypothetical protein